MRTLQIIKNQYDNIMKPLKWSNKVASNFINIIKIPYIIEKKDMIPQWKFVNVNNTKRCTESMETLDILILDFDDENYSIKEFENKFREFRYILHTSHSYNGTNQKFRVFLFLDKEYNINRLFFKGHYEQFNTYLLLLKKFEHVDPASFVRAQFFKMPSIKTKDSPYYYHINNGKTFNFSKEIGFEFDIAYNNCIEKQDEYLRYLDIKIKKSNKNGNIDLSNAKAFIDSKIESCEDGCRHNIVFALACWWKKIGGNFEDFESIMPSWADKSYKKQMNGLRKEWLKLR